MMTKHGPVNIHWGNMLFMIMAHFIGISGAIYYQMPVNFEWHFWLLVLELWASRAMGITAGYHRLFSHKTYECSLWVKVLMLLLGASALENSALKWVADHRRHHRYVDTNRDPYNIKRGGLWAHILWIVFKILGEKEDLSNVQDLLKDPIVMLQHKYYLWIAILMDAILPMVITWLLWGNPLMGLIASFIAAVLAWHATFFINSLAHMKHWFSTQSYSRANTAVDSPIVALLTFGEGYHNYHHAQAWDYRNGVRWYQYDPTKWLIFLLSLIGATWDLRYASDEEIKALRLAATLETA